MDTVTLRCSANLQDYLILFTKQNSMIFCTSILDTASWNSIMFVFLCCSTRRSQNIEKCPRFKYGNHRIAQIAIAAAVKRLIHIYKNKQIAIAVLFMKCHEYNWYPTNEYNGLSATREQTVGHITHAHTQPIGIIIQEMQQ